MLKHKDCTSRKRVCCPSRISNVVCSRASTPRTRSFLKESFRPRVQLLFDLLTYCEQKRTFGLVPEIFSGEPGSILVDGVDTRLVPRNFKCGVVCGRFLVHCLCCSSFIVLPHRTDGHPRTHNIGNSRGATASYKPQPAQELKSIAKPLLSQDSNSCPLLCTRDSSSCVQSAGNLVHNNGQEL